MTPTPTLTVPWNLALVVGQPASPDSDHVVENVCAGYVAERESFAEPIALGAMERIAAYAQTRWALIYGTAEIRVTTSAVLHCRAPATAARLTIG